MLAVKELQAIKIGEWATDGPAGPGKGSGVLAFRRVSSGALLAYFRFTRNDGSRGAYPIGQLAERGRAGLSLAEARNKAGELAQLYLSGAKDINAHFAEEERKAKEADEAALKAKEAEQKALEAAKEAAEREVLERKQYTLRKLCDSYTQHLTHQGKLQSAKHAGSIFKVHVLEADPDIADKPAGEVTRRDLTSLIRKTNEKGFVRAGGILRAYLSAAYSLALNAEGDSQAPSEMLLFNIQSNPVQGIKTIPVRSGDRVLNTRELRAYLSCLWSDNLIDQYLLLHLLTAGQRTSQLLRSHASEFDPSSGILRLWDPKGRRQEAREHLLPLGPIGCELVMILQAHALEKAEKRYEEKGVLITNPSLFLSSSGATMSASTPGKRVADIVAALEIEPFDLRDIRRTVETMLAGLGISRDVRAQLLSHGLSGVQNQHYDRHQYMKEKRDALIIWEQHLEKILASEDGTNGSTKKQPLMTQ